MQRPGDGMFFILGRGRSGTTLLSAILDSHPAVSVAPEALFALMMSRKYGRCRSWDADLVDSFLDDLFRERRILSWNIDRKGLRREILSLGGSTGYADICRCVYAHYAGRAGKPADALLGDKNPHYCLAAGKLQRLFPEARFVHMVRDPRDNVLSFRRVRFDLNSPGGLARRWCTYNTAVMRAAAHGPDRFHLLRFEDLLLEPERTLHGICAFLGVDYLPAMLEDHARSPAIPDLPWHGNVAGPLEARRAYRWRDSLSQSSACRIQSLCGSLTGYFGYPDACRKGPRRAGIRYALGSLLGRAATLFERMVMALPYRLAMAVTNAYRMRTGTLSDQGTEPV